MIRGQKPLAYKEVVTKYHESLDHIRHPAQLKIVASQYLPNWPRLLFQKSPIDAGLSMEECWEQLTTENPDAADLADTEPPAHDNFLHTTRPCALTNQMAVLALLGKLAKRDKTSLMYVRWDCGLGKTTCMMDLGHILAVEGVPAGKSIINVWLLLANEGLVKHYEKVFAEKWEEALPRVHM